MSRKKLVAGNWKMFTNTASARTLAEAVSAGARAYTDKVDVLVCPPFPYLGVVGEAIKGSTVQLGAQNCYQEREGAFTGEVSPVMLLDLGCSHVILGHSERRHKMGESNELINRKLRLALEAGLKVILCLGETLAEREGGHTHLTLATQVTGCLTGVTREHFAKLIFAYEPVWAIGTGVNASPEQAQEVHLFLRKRIAEVYGNDIAEALVIQYGGSVNATNAASIFAKSDVDGGLIGGASLKPDQFLAIVQAGVGG